MFSKRVGGGSDLRGHQIQTHLSQMGKRRLRKEETHAQSQKASKAELRLTECLTLAHNMYPRKAIYNKIKFARNMRSLWCNFLFLKTAGHCLVIFLITKAR